MPTLEDEPTAQGLACKHRINDKDRVNGLFLTEDGNATPRPCSAFPIDFEAVVHGSRKPADILELHARIVDIDIIDR